MCAKRLCAATALAAALSVAVAAPALAWPFGGKTDKPAADAKTDPKSAAKTPAKPDAKTDEAAKPVKATPAERLAAERLDPLASATFWAREVQIDPTEVEAGLKLSAALRVLGRYEEAAQSAQRVLVASPKNFDGLLELARSQIAAGQGFYAIQPLKDAQAARPKDWRPISMLGIAYEQSERPAEAKVAHEQAMAMEPNNPAVLSNVALFRANQGDKAGAEALLRRAVTLPGATARERQNLALVLGLQGKLAEAEQLIRQDLPPQTAEANLAYLKSASAPAPQARR